MARHHGFCSIVRWSSCRGSRNLGTLVSVNVTAVCCQWDPQICKEESSPVKELAMQWNPTTELLEPSYVDDSFLIGLGSSSTT